MAGNGRVIVGCQHGEENPDSVAVAYLTATAALDQGKEVVMWLTSEGVRLGLHGYADGIRADKEAVLDEIDRVLRPSGRLQIADVVIHHEVSEDTRKRIDLWTG